MRGMTKSESCCPGVVQANRGGSRRRDYASTVQKKKPLTIVEPIATALLSVNLSLTETLTAVTQSAKECVTVDGLLKPSRPRTCDCPYRRQQNESRPLLADIPVYSDLIRCYHKPVGGDSDQL